MRVDPPWRGWVTWWAGQENGLSLGHVLGPLSPFSRLPLCGRFCKCASFLESAKECAARVVPQNTETSLWLGLGNVFETANVGVSESWPFSHIAL